MTQEEGDDFMIRYFEKSIRDNEEDATRLEHLYPVVTDRGQAEFMKKEAEFLREQIKRLEEALKEWPRG